MLNGMDMRFIKADFGIYFYTVKRNFFTNRKSFGISLNLY